MAIAVPGLLGSVGVVYTSELIGPEAVAVNTGVAFADGSPNAASLGSR